MQIIGIDIGTTTISGAVLEYENEKTVKLLEAKTIENGGFMPTANEWEKIQDAGAIVKKQTERIGLTGQMHGIVYIDQTGTCVSPLYTWQDGRGSLCEKGQCSLVQEIKEKCDLEAASGYGLVTHIYNLKHGLVPERAVGFCTIMDYFGMCLTGRKKPVVHVSNAAGFGFFDGRNMKFETEKLSKMGVKENWLPEVCTGIEKLGLYRNRQVTTAIGGSGKRRKYPAGQYGNRRPDLDPFRSVFCRKGDRSQAISGWKIPVGGIFFMRRKVLCTAGTVFQKGRKGCYRRRQLSLSGDGTVCKNRKRTEQQDL